MPYVHVKDKNIYYREYGSGEPIVFLNGVMMTTSNWLQLAKTVSKDYKVILVDLLDQGRSDSCEKEYTIDTQAEILDGFLQELGIDNTYLLGVSYGGKVALTYTIKHQHKVKSLILLNTDAFTTNIMKDIGKSWAYAASTLDGEVFLNAVFPYVYSMEFYENNYDNIMEKKRIMSKVLNEEWKDRFVRNIFSTFNFDVSHLIDTIKVPTLIIGAEYDLITLKKYQEFIHSRIKNSQLHIIKGTGHAALFEKPKEVISILMDFLNKNTSLF